MSPPSWGEIRIRKDYSFFIFRRNRRFIFIFSVFSRSPTGDFENAIYYTTSHCNAVSYGSRSITALVNDTGGRLHPALPPSSNNSSE